MQNNKKFFSGLITGVVIVLALNIPFRILSNNLSITDMKLKQIDLYLNQHYIGDIDKENMLSKMDDFKYYGYVAALKDPYTTYMDAEQYKSYLEESSGEFAGIGVTVTVDKFDKLVTVNTVYEDAPAAKSGLLEGDKIIGVFDEDVTSLDLSEVVKKIKGPIDTDVELSIYRSDEERTFDVTIKRAKVTIPSIKSKILDNNIGYIMITSFDEITSNLFKTAYDNLRKDNIKGLIIDVRNNPGGSLKAVLGIADILIPEGTILTVEKKDGKKDIYKSDPDHIDIPLVMLVNENSASASEVLSGAVKDTKTGVLVGNTTFGKGVVQTLLPLMGDSGLKITMAKYYTPNNISIHDIGIEPDYNIKLKNDLIYKISKLTLEEDTQLQKAIEIISE